MQRKFNGEIRKCKCNEFKRNFGELNKKLAYVIYFHCFWSEFERVLSQFERIVSELKRI